MAARIRALGDLTTVGVLFGASHMVLLAATKLAWTSAPVALLLLVVVVNAIYGVIHELEHHGRIDDARRKRLIGTVYGWCHIPDYFAP